MLQTLQRIIQEVTLAKNLDQILSVIAENVQVQLKADVCNIFLVDHDTSLYVLLKSQGLLSESKEPVYLKLEEGLVGMVGQRGEPINLEHPSVHPSYYHHPVMQDKEYNAFLGAPIIYQRRLLGVITLLREEAQYFSEEEEAFLITVVARMARFIAVAQTDGLLSSAIGQKIPDGSRVLSGVPGSPGVAFGRAALVYPLADLDAVPEVRAIQDVNKEIDCFKIALDQVKRDIKRLSVSLGSLPVEEKALFEAYVRILDSPDIVDAVIKRIQVGNWAQGSLKQVIAEHVTQFENIDDAYLRERAADIRDLGRRILTRLQSSRRVVPHYPKQTILVGEEITATSLIEMPEGHLAGVVSQRGSTNSHVAILARALGVPTVMGVDTLSSKKIEGKSVIIDGYYGQVYVSPSSKIRDEFIQLAKEEVAMDEALNKLRDLPAKTLDGYSLPLYVNAGLAMDIHKALTVGAEGLGLFRTEVPFMVRDRFPSEDEQRVIYRQLLSAFSPRPVIMRTLDIGGDKVLPYFPLKEDNPFLGWRGIRVTLDHPEVFLMQLRAMLRASIGLNNLRIMFPMISVLNELDESLQLLGRARNELIEEGEAVPMPLVGVMLEVPSAIYQVRALAKQVDFLSVGTNDLIQYLLAVDRNNARVANLYDGLQPAVLRALKEAVEGAHAEKKTISICGEMAGDPMSAILLIAMGFDTLSMSATRLPKIKWVIRQFTLEKATQLLHSVMQLEDALEIRRQIELTLEQAGLGGLIRAGN